MGMNDPLYITGKQFHEADKHSLFALLSTYQKLPPYGKEYANYTESFLISSKLFHELLSEKGFRDCKKISLSLFAKELSIEDASEQFQNVLKKIVWRSEIKKSLSLAIKEISEGKTKEGFLVAPVWQIERNTPLVHQGTYEICAKADDIFDVLEKQIQEWFSPDAIEERLQKGYDVLDVHVEFLVGYIGTGKIYDFEMDIEHPDLGSQNAMCSVASQKSKNRDVYSISFHTNEPQCIDKDTHVSYVQKLDDQGKKIRKFVSSASDTMILSKLFHGVMQYIFNLKKQHVKGVFRAVGSKDGLFLISQSYTRISQDQLIHTKDIVVKETQQPMKETVAYSTGLFVSSRPHNHVVTVESLQEIPLVELLQYSVILLSKEQTFESKEDVLVLSYLREAGIPALFVDDAQFLSKQKTCTFFADGNLGVIYPGILPYEEYPIPKKSSLDTFVLAKVYDPEMIGHAKRLPVSGWYMSLVDMLGYYGVHPSQFFLEEKFSKELITIAATFPDASSGKKLFKMLLSRSIVQLAAGSFPNTVFVHLPDADSPEFLGEKVEDSTDWKNEYYEVIRDVLSHIESLQFSHVCAVSDVRSTPDEYREWHEYLLGHTSVKSGLFIDVYKNFTLRHEFECLTPYLFTKEITTSEDTDQLALWNRQMKKDTILSMLHSHVLDKTHLSTLMQKGIRGMVVETDMVLTYYHRMKTTERSIGRTGAETNIALLLFLGMLGILLALVLMYISGFAGFGSPVDIPEQSQPEISPSELRKKITEREQEKKEAEFLAQRSSLQVSDFAQFQLLYPSWWRVSYWNGGVTMVDEKTGEYVSIFIQKVGHPEQEDVADITIGGISGKVWNDEVGEEKQVVTIVELLFEEEVLEINGSTPLLSEILATMTFVEGGESADSVSHWDIREKRFCAQMITYAKKYADSACEAFPSPCEVPESYSVCDSTEE